MDWTAWPRSVRQHAQRTDFLAFRFDEHGPRRVEAVERKPDGTFKAFLGGCARSGNAPSSEPDGRPVFEVEHLGTPTLQYLQQTAFALPVGPHTTR